jgi:peptide/nickel transport system substrate-binding protein
MRVLESKRLLIKPIEEEERDAEQKYEIRENKKGKKLELTLVTSDKPYYYRQVAEYLREDYGKIGINLNIKVLNMDSFLDRVKHREYDILLYGQSLGYNLDIYEFFHESQVGKDNLSDYQSPIASVLIEEIRRSHVSDVRTVKMQKLRELFKQDIPAVFLFSPTYQYYFDEGLKGLNISSVGSHKDRFSNIENAYIVEQRSLKNSTWLDFPQWFLNNYISFITFSL